MFKGVLVLLMLFGIRIFLKHNLYLKKIVLQPLKVNWR